MEHGMMGAWGRITGADARAWDGEQGDMDPSDGPHWQGRGGGGGRDLRGKDFAQKMQKSNKKWLDMAQNGRYYAQNKQKTCKNL